MCNLTRNVRVKIAADLSCNGSEKWKDCKIDSCIANLVQALQLAGIDMRSSCCGHGKGEGEITLADGRILLILPKSMAIRYSTKRTKDTELALVMPLLDKSKMTIRNGGHMNALPLDATLNNDQKGFPCKELDVLFSRRRALAIPCLACRGPHITESMRMGEVADGWHWQCKNCGTWLLFVGGKTREELVARFSSNDSQPQ